MDDSQPYQGEGRGEVADARKKASQPCIENLTLSLSLAGTVDFLELHAMFLSSPSGRGPGEGIRHFFSNLL